MARCLGNPREHVTDGRRGAGKAASVIRRRRMLALAGALSVTLTAARRRGATARPVLGVDHAELPLRPWPAVRSIAQDAPVFSDVAGVDADEALAFLAGRHRGYPGANLDSLMGYSAADILETTDTDVMDVVYARHGSNAVSGLYRVIAARTLESLLVVYDGAPVFLALDAGHGGKRGVFFDPGSGGTEADHARRVVAAIEDVAAADPRYGGTTVRRIFNDEIGDDFGLPPPNDRKGAAALTIRNVRGAMLAHEAAAWNRAHPQAPVAVHVVSVHFNAGSGGILVLHQGDTVPAVFRQRSIAFAREYVAATGPALNATGLLPYALRPALGTGLSDDHLLYEPQFRVSPINPFTGVDRSRFPRRYAMLQASLLQRDYADGALRYRGLVRG